MLSAKKHDLQATRDNYIKCSYSHTDDHIGKSTLLGYYCFSFFFLFGWQRHCLKSVEHTTTRQIITYINKLISTVLTFSYLAITSKMCLVSGYDAMAFMNSSNKLELAGD